MKIFNDKIPQYSACVMVELHSNQTIRVLYRNNTFTNETFTLIIPGNVKKTNLYSIQNYHLYSIENLTHLYL